MPVLKGGDVQSTPKGNGSLRPMWGLGPSIWPPVAWFSSYLMWLQDPKDPSTQRAEATIKRLFPILWIQQTGESLLTICI